MAENKVLKVQVYRSPSQEDGRFLLAEKGMLTTKITGGTKWQQTGK